MTPRGRRRLEKVDFKFGDPKETRRNEWRWRLLVRSPDQLSAPDLRPIRKSLVEKKHLDTSSIKRITWTEGLALQMLHVGPYDTIGAAYEELMASAREHGLECAGAGHEIYLNDPRRVAPARIKTIVRMGMRRAPKR